MAIYRTVSMTFWTDPKVTDDFTPEDRYFYLYLFTNPHTNLSGCYEISLKQMSTETGYSKDSIENLLKRFDKVHDVIRYCTETKEILLLNWHRYNWTESPKFRKPLEKEIQAIKDNYFREYLQKIFDGEEEGYRIDTNCIDTTVTVTDTVINNINIQSKGIINNSNNNSEYVDLDSIWKQTFEAYPKKSNYASAKTKWMDRLLPVIEKNRSAVAGIIWRAIKAYLKDYSDKNPDDLNYRYVPSFNKWLTEDLDYWMEEVRRKENA